MKHNQVRQVVFPLLTALIWGTAFVAQDVCADAMDSMTFNASRFFIAFLALLVIVFIFDRLKKDHPSQTAVQRKQARKSLALGGFCCGTALALAAYLQQAGMTAGTDAGKAGFITALYIVLVPIFGLFLHKKVSLPIWISVALAVVALYLLCITSGFSIAPGDILMLACAAGFAVHILVCDHFTQFVDGMKLSCIQFLVAAVWSSIGMFILETPTWSSIVSCALPILYVGIFSSGVGYTLQILAQKDSNPTVVTLLLSMESVFAVLAGAVLLHQQMSMREYMGCLLMLVAVVLAQIPFPQRKKAVLFLNFTKKDLFLTEQVFFLIFFGTHCTDTPPEPPHVPWKAPGHPPETPASGTRCCPRTSRGLP